MNNYKSLAEFLEVWSEISTSERKTLPLCAAENVTSEFVNIPRGTFLQDKYILGGTLEYVKESNFFGSEKLYKIYELINKQCAKMYKSNYSDARTFSGMSAITALMMALFKTGDHVLIASPEIGGHSSMAFVCMHLGINFEYLPYNNKEKDFDYDYINCMLSKHKIDGILIALSDMIEQPKLNQLELGNTVLIYDATQILGMIGSGVLVNPFDWFSANQNVILMGATHKTLPGPACGLIMTQNKTLAKSIDKAINPELIRNVQLDNIVSLLFALYELEEFGSDYFESVRRCADIIGSSLTTQGIKLLTARDGKFTHTHQLWISLPENIAAHFERNVEMAGISLNIRKREIYGKCGVRLGVQQIARYNWDDNAIRLIAEILLHTMSRRCNPKQVRALIEGLPPRIVNFTYDADTVKTFKAQMLHYSYM